MRVGPLILFLAGLLACTASPPGPERLHVVLIVVDTLRADHLSVYGYERQTSPGLQRLGFRGWVFERHVSHAAQTVPSTVSLLVSQLPAEHGLVHRRDGQFVRTPPVFAEGLQFLSEVLRDHGYRTAGFVGNPFFSAESGLAQGFDDYVHRVDSDRELVDGAVHWLRSRAREPAVPFYLYLHLMEVHWPYDPSPAYLERYRRGPGRLVYRNGLAPEMTRRDLDYTVASYDAGVRFVDDLVLEVTESLDELGLGPDTIVVVTSDHGDEFLEHGGLGHGTTVYGELVRVPLVVVHPGALEPGRRVAHLTQHLDLAPTILSWVGIEAPDSFRGGNLLAEPERAFSESRSWRSVYARDHKLVLNLEDGRAQVFAAEDALDVDPLADESAEQELREQIDAYLRLERSGAEALGDPGSGAPAGGWSREELEHLEALGYVGETPRR
jgi:arylsulfatase A-like enzyme